MANELKLKLQMELLVCGDSCYVGYITFHLQCYESLYWNIESDLFTTLIKEDIICLYLKTNTSNTSPLLHAVQ